MKILEKKIWVNQPGTLKIIPEEPDDLFLAYSLISIGDVITTQTSRKVHQSTVSGKNKNPCRVHVKLEISVAAVDYKGSSALRISGKNLAATEHVNAGLFHTLELDVNKEFSLRKKVWDAQAVKKLEDYSSSGCDDLAVLLMDEGLANLFSIGKSGSKCCAKVEERPSPKTGLAKFFERVFWALTRHVDFNTVRCVVIASPGRTKQEFRQYLVSEAQRLKMKQIEKNKSRLVLVNTSSGKESSLKEVLCDLTVMQFVKHTKAAVAMREFTELLSTDLDRVCYGLRSVEAADELRAIETLMITNELYRSGETVLRKKCVGLVESVKEAGGKAVVFSRGEEEEEEELAKLTGVAAILRFPLPDLDQMVL
ncbi:protein PELOTA 1-like [Diospyros lotus]|uniref:protein PELOTA 1-like n=1 Tax=Diospyros lotus TaxID=55363 RepID=UPI00225A8F1D|nr:protein PELOTA 1-like [Diospyros lotus]